LLFLLPTPSATRTAWATGPTIRSAPRQAPGLPRCLPPLVSPENVTGIRAMPRHAFGARPGHRYKYQSKDDDGQEGRQNHPFMDLGHFLPTPLHEPSLSRRSPPATSLDPADRAIPTISVSSLRSQVAGMGGIVTAASAIFSDCDGKPHRRRRHVGSEFVDRAGGTREMQHGTSRRSV
jgi:hypothetical protein